MKQQLGLAFILTTATAGASAADPFQYLDLYYLLDSEIVNTGSFQTTEYEQSGYGIAGSFRTGDQSFFKAEYQTAEIDQTDAETEQLRIALGGHSIDSGSSMYGQLGYISLEGDTLEQDGLTVHAGLAFGERSTHFFAEMGYLDLDDADGLEYAIGGRAELADDVGLFAQYRNTTIEDDSGYELEMTDIQIGVSLSFY